jgi:hypothetical protein
MLALTDLPSLSSFVSGPPGVAKPSAQGRRDFDVSESSATAPFAVGALAALEDDELATRFCAWRGASERRYIFSVYEPRSCPAYFNAILLVAARGPDGRRRALRVLDTSIFPEPVVARERERAERHPEPIEFHLHLLARGFDERRRVLDDLEAAGAYAPRS